jgi:hypothetical protein
VSLLAYIAGLSYTLHSKVCVLIHPLRCLQYPFSELHLNPYDVRRKCDRDEDGDLCYKQMAWIDQYMNDPSVKAELGVSPSLKFQSCNIKVGMAWNSS